jgi:hypothetical protein
MDLLARPSNDLEDLGGSQGVVVDLDVVHQAVEPTSGGPGVLADVEIVVGAVADLPAVGLPRVLPSIDVDDRGGPVVGPAIVVPLVVGDDRRGV